jgi:hypothetical protein
MKKVAHYRRASWTDDNSKTLSDMFSACFERVDENRPPIFSFNKELDCVVAKRDVKRTSTFLQLVAYERGASAAVIPALTRTDALEADTAAPPEGTEYIQSQLFCIARGNHLVWTAHNSPLREGRVNLLLAKMIYELAGKNAKNQFMLQAKLDKSALEKTLREGIAEINLGVGDFKPTLEALLSPDGLSGMPTALKSLVQKSPKPDEIEAAANVMGRLTLRPGRRWNKPHVKELLSDMASNIIESYEDEFVIVTKSGVRLTKEKISVHKEYEVEGNKQILYTPDVQININNILDDLEDNGLLE